MNHTLNRVAYANRRYLTFCQCGWWSFNHRSRADAIAEHVAHAADKRKRS